MTKVVIKKKRKVRKSVVIGFLIIVIAIVSLFTVPNIVNKSKLKKLGYNNATIQIIQKKNYTSLLLKENAYSNYLEKCISDDTFDPTYLQLYTVVDEKRGLTDDDFLLYHRLEDLGYEDDQLLNLFQNLNFWEITPLLLFDYQWDESKYIEDCISHRDTNSSHSFSLKNDYWIQYKLQSTITNPDITSLINATYHYDENYVPSDLVTLTQEYAAANQQLCSEVADAFLTMAKDAYKDGVPFFASNAYRDYATQDAAYQFMYSHYGEKKADILSIRAGHSEHQSGLAVNITSTYEDNSDFTSTKAYAWLMEHAVDYGFIARYPEEKSTITNMSDETAHFRYLGKDLAKKVTDSQLTYDEYYLLYLSPWYDDTYLPKQSLIERTGCNSKLMNENVQPTETPSN